MRMHMAEHALVYVYCITPTHSDQHFHKKRRTQCVSGVRCVVNPVTHTVWSQAYEATVKEFLLMMMMMRKSWP